MEFLLDSLPIVITSVVSIVSIFISNILGRKATLSNHVLENEEKSYQNYYVPLIKWLYRHNDEYINYYWCIAVSRLHIKQNDFLNDHLKQHIELAPTDAVIHFNSYMVKSSGAEFFYKDQVKNAQYEKNAIEASEKFDLIIKSSLKEASKLAKKLGYPDIAAPLLKSCCDGISSQDKTDRYIPEIYRM